MRIRTIAALVAGAATASIGWLAVVPWDLSEVDEVGRVVQGSGVDGQVLAVAVLGLVVLAGVGLALLRPDWGQAVVFTSGGSVAWAVLFAWRASTARTSGANMYLLALVVVVLPLAWLAPVLVRLVARKSAGRVR